MSDFEDEKQEGLLPCPFCVGVEVMFKKLAMVYAHWLRVKARKQGAVNG